MKKNVLLLGIILLPFLFGGCKSDNTYSKLRDKEKKLISEYLDREEINVLDEIPAVWGEKDYYAVPNYDDFYIHVIEVNDTCPKLKAGDVIVMRYKKYGLSSYSDTTRYWNTDDGPYGLEFQLGNTSDVYYCLGWTEAIGVMKYSGSCRIICPSKLGFVADNSSVTPYGYELKFKKKP